MAETLVKTRTAAAIGTTEREPEPTSADITSLQEWLKTRFREFHGEESTNARGSSGDYDTGPDSIRRIRQVRYGRDALPAKLAERNAYAYRVRSMLTHNEIEQVASLLGRNDLQYEVPAASGSKQDRERADRQTRWLQHLPDSLERHQRDSIVQALDDSIAESGVMVAELYMTTAWDGIDPALPEDELMAERRRAGLPFGVRPLDPLSVMWDSDEQGPYVATITEKKRYRPVYNRLKARLSSAEWQQAALPHPRDAGVPEGESSFGTEVETIRYYDRTWYAYVVGGKLVEVKAHGLPCMPVIIQIGGRTSASTFPEQFHGVAWGRASIEQALNDLMTHDLDTRLTYRNLPMFVADAKATDMTDGEPKVFRVEPGMALPPGWRIENAFAGFVPAQNDPAINLLMSLHRMGGVSSVASGESPGADAAGYTVNLLMGAANARYLHLLKAKQRFWEQVGDAVRLMVRDTIGETVYLSVPMQDRKRGGTEWLGLDPEDVDETPSAVAIDPLDDANRIAISKWLEGGVAAGVVPERELMLKGYGADDVEEWRDEIDRDAARKVLRQKRIEMAMQELEEEAPAAPVILGPDGQPLPPSVGDLQNAGGLPAPLQPPTVGAQQMQDQAAMQPPGPQRMGGPVAGQRPVNIPGPAV